MSAAADRPSSVVVDKGVEFARVGGQPLLLDLYRPSDDHGDEAPVVVYAHGGGWARGDREMGAATRLEPFAAHGVAVASVDYRLVPAVKYPDPVLDVRSAIAFLRREGARWNLATERVGAWGASAGGHLALMAGLAGELTPSDGALPDGALSDGALLDGAAAEGAAISGRPDAIVNWFGVSDLVALSTRSPLETMTRPHGTESMLLGVDNPADALDVARSASPIDNVRAGGPPVLTMHGDRDQMVPFEFSTRLHDALTRLGVDSTLVVLGGVGHEDPAFDRPDTLAYTTAWLRARLTVSPGG